MRSPVVLAFVLAAGIHRSSKQGCRFGALWLLGLALGPGDGWHGSKSVCTFLDLDGCLLSLQSTQNKKDRLP